MGMAMFFGCLFITFSLPAALFLSNVVQSAKLIIVFVSSSFFWLLALLASSIVWNIIVPLKEERAVTLLFAVPLIEYFRFLFWRLLRKADALGLLDHTEDEPALSRQRIA